MFSSDSKLTDSNSCLKIAVLGTRGFPGVRGGIEAHCENLFPRLVNKGCELEISE